MQVSKLTRDTIARAALELVDDGGLEALTMRRLGRELGVEAMSLYQYVANKDQLLDELLTLLYAEIDLPTYRDRDWRDVATDLFAAFRVVLMAHPKTVVIFAARSVTSMPALAPIDMSLGIFRRAGFGSEAAVDAHRILMSFTIGYLLAETTSVSRPDAIPRNSWGTAAFALADLRADKVPYLAELAPVALNRNADDQFELCLGLVVSGLSALQPEVGDDPPKCGL